MREKKIIYSKLIEHYFWTRGYEVKAFATDINKIINHRDYNPETDEISVKIIPYYDEGEQKSWN